MKPWRMFWIVVLLIQSHEILVKVSALDGFVGTREVHLMLNGSPFYANGFNAYWLMYIASDPSQRNKVSSAFQQASSLGLTVARTWAFSDGGYSPLQYSPGSYNEQMFQGLDFVISEARRFGVKLILSLVNNYDNLGGKQQYVDWARSQGQSISSEDDFYTNPVVKGYYKNHVKTVLTRQNTITGVSYKDDPTIMAWELMNEPRCNSDLSGKTLEAWITEMASYLKSIDGAHLLEVGLEGFYGESSPEKQQYNPNFQVGTDFIAHNQIPGIDFATVHSYPDQWLIGSSDDQQLSFLNTWINTHIQDAQNILQKPVIFAEFGKTYKDSGYSTYKRDQIFNAVYSAVYASASSGGAAASGLFWQLLTQGIDNLRDGYEIIFNESPSTDSIIAEQSQKLNKVRKMYVHLRNVDRLKRAREIRDGQQQGTNNSTSIKN
ncbi:Glycoside hydrolase, family 5 [Dillenia turbinata]|uniref:mannan endo-1,4-beta-mannosidase n=1 Tax=Dillenia turbinata TaxID=194707 RepID=A0AAN8ZMI7_9MAGN